MRTRKNSTDKNTKICVITGATSGIGRATVLQFAKHNVPAFTLVGGIPAKPITKVTVPMTLEDTSF
jgi:hypothetical protein